MVGTFGLYLSIYLSVCLSVCLPRYPGYTSLIGLLLLKVLLLLLLLLLCWVYIVDWNSSPWCVLLACIYLSICLSASLCFCLWNLYEYILFIRYVYVYRFCVE